MHPRMESAMPAFAPRPRSIITRAGTHFPFPLRVGGWVDQCVLRTKSVYVAQLPSTSNTASNTASIDGLHLHRYSTSRASFCQPASETRMCCWSEVFFYFFSGMHHCVTPYVDISLHRGWFHGRPHIGANGVSCPSWKMDEKLKSENTQKRAVFCVCYILRAIKAGRCREQRYADHIFIQIYFRMHHFVVKFSKFSSPQVARGHWPP